MTNTLKKLKVRDYNAMSACFQKAGFMHDRRASRGGSRNYHREYLDDAASEEFICDFCGKSAEALRRIALDDGYDRLTTNDAPKYACGPCSTKKEETRLEMRSEMVSAGV